MHAIKSTVEKECYYKTGAYESKKSINRYFEQIYKADHFFPYKALQSFPASPSDEEIFYLLSINNLL